LEGILTHNQVRRLRVAIGRGASRALGGRYRFTRAPSSKAIATVSDLDGNLNREREILSANGGTSALFQSLVVYRDAPDVQPQGKFSTAQIELRKAMRPTPVQIDLGDRLDRLNRDILLARLARDRVADDAPSLDWEAANWLDAWYRARDSFVAHAETLLLQGILTPFQAEALLASYWRQIGPEALADPELASRLGLSRGQRSSLDEQLVVRQSIYDEEVLNLICLMNTEGKRDALGRDLSVLAREAKPLVEAEADSTVWSVLTRSQLKELQRILGPGAPVPKPPAGKRGSTRQR
jgi:hypothetical protein